MRRQLDAYLMGQVDLDGLITSLEVLQGVLEAVPEDWRDRFRDQWAVLEQVYSVAVVRGEPVQSRENEALIAPALAEMRELLDDALADQ